MPKLDDKKPNNICISCFKSLGVEARFKIYSFLRSNNNACVTDIVDHVGLTQPTVSYHLHDMQEAGLLESKKNGKSVYYSISNVCPNNNSGCVLKDVAFSS